MAIRFKQFMEQEAQTAPMPTDPKADAKKSYDSKVFNREFGIAPEDHDDVGDFVTCFGPLPGVNGMKASGPITLKVLSKTDGKNGRVQVQVVGDLLNKQKVINKAGAVSSLPYPTQPFWLSRHDFEMIKLMPFNKAGAAAPGGMGGGMGGLGGGMGGPPGMGMGGM